MHVWAWLASPTPNSPNVPSPHAHLQAPLGASASRAQAHPARSLLLLPEAQVMARKWVLPPKLPQPQ